MGVSKNRGTPKLSIFIGFSIINHPFWEFYLYFWNTHIFLEYFENLIFSLNHLMTADVGKLVPGLLPSQRSSKTQRSEHGIDVGFLLGIALPPIIIMEVDNEMSPIFVSFHLG